MWSATTSHQEMVLVFSLQVGRVVPLENTWWCATLTTPEQHQIQSPNFFRAFTRLDINTPRNTKKCTHNVWIGLPQKRKALGLNKCNGSIDCGGKHQTEVCSHLLFINSYQLILVLHTNVHTWIHTHQNRIYETSTIVNVAFVCNKERLNYDNSLMLCWTPSSHYFVSID
jgi:hypothetical protein